MTFLNYFTAIGLAGVMFLIYALATIRFGKNSISKPYSKPSKEGTCGLKPEQVFPTSENAGSIEMERDDEYWTLKA